jgi:hypothetical protein
MKLLLLLFLILLILNFILNCKSNFKNTIYLAGVANQVGPINQGFVAKLLTSTSTIKLKNLKYKLNLESRDSPIGLYTIPSTSIIITLVITRSGNIPNTNNITPYIPGKLPWNNLSPLPSDNFNYQNIGILYQHPTELLYADVLSFTYSYYFTEQLKSEYCTLDDKNFKDKEILLNQNDSIYLIIKYGSQYIPINNSGFNFNGLFSWE